MNTNRSRGAWAVPAGVLVASLLGALLLQWDRTSARATRQAQGEAMYRLGRLPSGAPMTALIRDDLAVDGEMFACVSCHLASGFGTAEGQLVAPPVDATTLFNPVTLRYKGVEIVGAPPRRPAYTPRTLAQAIRAGVDPTGRTLNEAMPRYAMTDVDAAVLVDYLASLSEVPSEGVTEGTIRLATIMTEDVPAPEREAMLFVLEKYVAFKNAQAQPRETGVDNRSARMATAMLVSRDVAFKKLVLMPWVLRGKPDGWRRQLESLYQAAPPFALVGGISTQSWAPIHEFAEAKRLPTLLPITDLPSLSEENSYTMYATRGLAQEGAGVARYLANLDGEARPRTVIELVRDTPLGRALAAGFDETRRELGQTPARIIRLPRGEPIPDLELGHHDEPAAVLLWDGPEALAALQRLQAPNTRVFLSSTALGDALGSIEEPLRARVSIAWPYRLPDEEEPFAAILHPWLKATTADDARPGARVYRVAASAFALTQVLTQGLMDLRGHYSRDYLLEVIGMMKDQRLPSYERLSFGIGQRVLSKGCHVVELGPGESPRLVKKSPWLTH